LWLIWTSMDGLDFLNRVNLQPYHSLKRFRYPHKVCVNWDKVSITLSDSGGCAITVMTSVPDPKMGAVLSEISHKIEGNPGFQCYVWWNGMAKRIFFSDSEKSNFSLTHPHHHKVSSSFSCKRSNNQFKSIGCTIFDAEI
jgi:hypothetical protein